MAGNFSSTGLQASFFGCFRHELANLVFAEWRHQMYQVDLLGQVLWFMARKKGEFGVFVSPGLRLSKILKFRTGHHSVPVANIFGLNCRWCEPSNPWRVLLLLSANQTKISLSVSGSICSSKSPQQSFWLSSLALKPK